MGGEYLVDRAGETDDAAAHGGVRHLERQDHIVRKRSVRRLLVKG